MPIPLRKRILFRLIRFFPPYLGAGISLRDLDPDLRYLEVQMKLWPWNRNYVGTHFGGSLYSMCDPFYMLMLIERLGRGYIVWDKAATIRYLSPGRGTMRARFELPDEEVERIRRALETEPKIEPRYVVEVKNDAGEVIARVEKTLYIRKKAPRKDDSKPQDEVRR